MVVIFTDSMLMINDSNSSFLEIDGMMEKVRTNHYHAWIIRLIFQIFVSLRFGNF